MNCNKLFTVILVSGLVAACGGSGDINIQPETAVSNSNNTTVTGGGGGENDICASYVRNGQTIQGTADGNGNCTYGSAFVGPKNNLTVDLLIPALADGGAHVFTSSLFVGETYRSNADLQAAGIAAGGDGPTLTVEAGATLAFQTNKDFIIINRGSRILANGTADAPITFTSVSDINGTVGPEDVQQWGGIVINGFGVSNKCSYVGTRGDAGFMLDPANPECHIEAEGSAGDDESQYGGDNDADDSGILRYVVVKHTGAEVANGDELNGISFGGVGSSTVVENLQVYSTFDDGIEMFGGSVSFTNLVALYVRDDSIDVDEGWNGSITNALVIQSQNDGNHCIEADGIGSYRETETARNADLIARGLNSAPTISNLTCIVSANLGGTHGEGAGWRLREGIHPVINDSLLISSFGANDQTDNDDNYCLRIDNPETQDAAVNGDLQLNSVIVACQEPSKGNATGAFASEQAWAESVGNQFATVADGTAQNPTAAADTDLQLLEGAQPIYSLSWATSFVDGAAPIATTAPTSGDFLGAVEATADWTAPWAFGISDTNRGQPLWFE
ncbi:MAG: serine/threonine protein kinase [Halieaceae bacterium]|nr:serine/threonine protein kinase [Halieaceae bacterium]